jgi:hypothetical protein
MSRSEFFTRAAVAYLGELESKSLSAQINAALELIGDDESYQDVVEAGRALHRRTTDSSGSGFGLLPFDLMSDIDRGLRLVIGL